MKYLRNPILVALAVVTIALGAAKSSAASGDRTAVVDVLSRYNSATQRLDVSKTRELFTPDSEIIENGNVEGTFDRYLEHHIGPELKEFKSFVISDYKVNVVVQAGFAFATETFRFRIEPKEGDAVERLAVATSVLRRGRAGWKIFRYHWSSRKPPPAQP